MSDDELLIETRGQVEIWRLNRPTRRNALGLGLLDLLDRARLAASVEGVCEVVVIAGHEAGRCFCAGFDLDDLRRLAAAGASTETSASRLHEVFAGIESAPFTVLTAIRGPAVGGGCELAMLGELRVAHPDATFTLPPARLGLVYPRAGMLRLEAALGRSLLAGMLLTASAVSARRLHEAGILWELSGDPEATALSLAETIAAFPRASRVGNRELLRALRSPPRTAAEAIGRELPKASKTE